MFGLITVHQNRFLAVTLLSFSFLAFVNPAFSQTGSNAQDGLGIGQVLSVIAEEKANKSEEQQKSPSDLQYLTGESGAPDASALRPPGANSGVSVPGAPVVDSQQALDENLFFDANDLVPVGEIGARGPRKINPAVEPASKFIVVRKNAGAESKPAQLVAADRAIKLGRYDAALEMYDSLHKRRSNDTHILMGRALALQNLGRTEEAILAYQQILDQGPNLEAEVNMLGLMSQQYPAVALQRLMALHGNNPNNASIVAQAAVIYAKMNQYDEALQYLGIAASMEPNNANHLFNIAVIADRAGKKGEAVDYYERALEADTIYGGGRSIPRDSVYERLSQLR